MPRSNFGCLVHAFGKRPHVWLKAGDCASKNLEGTEANHGLADAALALRGLGCMYELGGFRMGFHPRGRYWPMPDPCGFMA